MSDIGNTSDSIINSVHEAFGFLNEATNIKDAVLRSVDIETIGHLLPGGEWLSDSEQLNAMRDQVDEQIDKPLVSKYLGSGDVDDVRKREQVLFLLMDGLGVSKGLLGVCRDGNDIALELIYLTDEQATSEYREAIVSSISEWTRRTIYHDRFLNLSDESMMLSRAEEKVGSDLILTAGPSISAREAVYAFDAAKTGWNRKWSGYLNDFEAEFAKYVGVKYALATSSCTGALQIALMTLGIGPGDEVIVPDLTWVATANAVRYVGAIPIFADVELDTWNLDADSVESLITDKTKAVMVVHMYGHPARMTRLKEVADRYGLRLVEDAAPAIGAEWKGQRCGSFGDFAGFSFQGAKLLVTGEGGMLVTDDEELYQKALKIWDQGRNPSKVFWIDADGVKYKMSNVQAAVGLGQLQRTDALVEMKRRVFRWYEECLEDVPYVTLNKEVENARSIYWMSSIFLDESSPMQRDELIKALKEHNVDSRPVFPAISQYPIWPLKQEPKPTAFRIGKQAINLPSGVCLKREEVDYVCTTIKKLLA